MQNHTVHRASVRPRSAGLQIDSVPAARPGAWFGLSTGATPAASSKRRTDASASSKRPLLSRNRTDSGSPNRTTRAYRVGTMPTASAQRQPSGLEGTNR